MTNLVRSKTTTLGNWLGNPKTKILLDIHKWVFKIKSSPSSKEPTGTSNSLSFLKFLILNNQLPTHAFSLEILIAAKSFCCYTLMMA